jgi:hypothetical protein
MVILPDKTLDEIRYMTEDKVSFLEMVRREFLHRHTTIGDNRPEVIQAVKNELTRNISSVLDCLQDEVRYSLDKEIGDCPDWKPIYLYRAMANVVALMSGRTFVGLPLSREQEWLDVSINFTIDAVAAARAARKWHPLMRPFVAPFLKEIRRVKEYKKRGAELLAPYMEQKVLDQIMDEPKKSVDEEQSAFTGWVLKYTKDSEKRDPSVLALNQIVCKHTTFHYPWSMKDY